MTNGEEPRRPRTREQRLDAILRTSRVFNENVPNVDRLLETVAERVALLTGGACAVRLLSDDGEQLRFAAVYHSDAGLRDDLRRMMTGSQDRASWGVWGPVIAERRVIRTDVRAQGPRPEESAAQLEHVRARQVRGSILVPMVARDHVVGGLAVVRYADALPYDDDDEQMMRELADRAALAIDNARLVRDLERLGAELEQRVATRTAEYLEAKKEADEASRAKSAFLANMSHELRTPLNAILGFSDLLEERLPDSGAERERRYLVHISEAGQHLLALINDVLDLSKVEAGKFELHPERVTLAALLEPPLVNARVEAAARGITLHEEGVGPVELVLDPGRIRQVLYNLLSNAVKFTPSGGTVTLRARADGDVLRLEVEDTGIGIPRAEHARVFGTFERLHENANAAPGTGLGLALTRGIVDLHHGQIAFESEEGRGSRFFVELPGVVVTTITGPRILVVEDDPRDAALVAELATSFDLHCEIVSTVEEAQRALARARPVALVLDLRLPGARGETLFEAMQRDRELATIPVVVITVEDALPHSLTRLAGIDAYLTKPIERARLAAWLERIARQSGIAARAGG